MNAFERFLAGDDALARLIRNQPAFEPSAEQEARLLAAISSLESASESDFDFDPPAHMEAAFLQHMHAVQQDQAPRRDALLSRLHSGEAASELLGHPVSSATQDWLASQPAPAPVARKSKPPRSRSRWWEWSGLVFAGAMVAVVGVRLFAPSAVRPQVQTALNGPASAPVPQANEAAALLAAAPVAASLPSAAPPVTSRRSAPVVASLSRKPDAPRLAAAPTNVASAPEAPMQLAVVAPPPMLMMERGASRNEAFSDLAEALESTPTKAAMAPPPVARLKAARLAAPAPVRHVIALSEDPAEVVRRLSAQWGEAGLTLYAADPRSAVVQAWVERLRAVLPPQISLTVLPRPDLAPERVELHWPGK